MSSPFLAGPFQPNWNPLTTYVFGNVAFHNGGIWFFVAEKPRRNSEPISGNADWMLVAGTPYVQVTFTPPELFAMGVDLLPRVVVPAPGDGLSLIPLRIVRWGTAGVNWSASMAVAWGDGTLLNPGSGDISDVLQNEAPPLVPVYSMLQKDNPGAAIPNSALTALAGGSISGGTRSLVLRVYYDIVPAFPFPSTEMFFQISAVEQATKSVGVVSDPTSTITLGETVSIVGSTGNDGTYTVTAVAEINTPRAITAVNQGTQTFTVVGDHRNQFMVGTNPVVSGSTGNDDTYTVAAVTFTGGNTLITIMEPIPSAVADGTITEDVFVVTFAQALPDATADGWVNT